MNKKKLIFAVYIVIVLGVLVSFLIFFPKNKDLCSEIPKSDIVQDDSGSSDPENPGEDDEEPVEPEIPGGQIPEEPSGPINPEIPEEPGAPTEPEEPAPNEPTEDDVLSCVWKTENGSEMYDGMELNISVGTVFIISYEIIDKNNSLTYQAADLEVVGNNILEVKNCFSPIITFKCLGAGNVTLVLKSSTLNKEFSINLVITN